MTMMRRLAGISLLWKFAIVNLIPILLLGVVLQQYLHARVQERSVSNATTDVALDLQERGGARPLGSRPQHGLALPEVRALDEELGRPEIQDEIRRSRSGTGRCA